MSDKVEPTVRTFFCTTMWITSVRLQLHYMTYTFLYKLSGHNGSYCRILGQITIGIGVHLIDYVFECRFRFLGSALFWFGPQCGTVPLAGYLLYWPIEVDSTERPNHIVYSSLIVGDHVPRTATDTR